MCDYNQTETPKKDSRYETGDSPSATNKTHTALTQMIQHRRDCIKNLETLRDMLPSRLTNQQDDALYALLQAVRKTLP